jgi:DNA repair protein RadC
MVGTFFVPDMKTKEMTYLIRDKDMVFTAAPRQTREYVLRLRDLPVDKKPREKLVKDGPRALGLPELIAVVLNTGTTKEDVLSMSQRIVREYGGKSISAYLDAKKTSDELSIPIGKACQVVACAELVRRFSDKSRGASVIRTAKDAFDYTRDMHRLPKEHLKGIYLDTHNRVIHEETISVGTINSNIVHPREVFRPAIEYGAAAVILVHNHPSGLIEPSAADIAITRQLVEAGRLMGMPLLDHVIVAEGSHASIPADYEH